MGFNMVKPTNMSKLFLRCLDLTNQHRPTNMDLHEKLFKVNQQNGDLTKNTWEICAK